METHHNNSEARIFQNQILEAFTKTSPAITLIHYSAISILLLTAGFSWSGIRIVFVPLLYFGGIFYWTLFEYFMHRYVFHINEHIRGTGRFQFIMHGVHHQHPKDEARVFMPPVPGLIIALLMLGFHYLLMGKAAYFFTAGMVTGYMLYSFIHYTVHLKPPHPRFRKLWQHHSLHHYRYPDKAFGVSSPLWDMVFGTMPPKEKSRQHEPN